MTPPECPRMLAYAGVLMRCLDWLRRSTGIRYPKVFTYYDVPGQNPIGDASCVVRLYLSRIWTDSVEVYLKIPLF
jgi:hypothetical protein